MKLTAIILLGFCLHLSAKTSSQTVTYSANDAELEAVLSSVEAQTGFVALFEASSLKKAKKVTISANEMPLLQFLAQLFKDQPLNYYVKSHSIIVSPIKDNNSVAHVFVGSPEMPPVKGIVNGPDGKPLVGASIRVKGKRKAVLTDENGAFTISVDQGDVLFVSYIGFYDQDIRIDSTYDLTIRLTRIEQNLDTAEVVINTGYQKMRPNEANSSVVVLYNKALNQQAGTNILDRLQDITSGLTFNPGYSNGNTNNKTNISIRGLSTINGPQDPLIILDNFPYHGDINNISPNDIQSVTILKDAAAASIWGARAGNGVIVITTKKGRLNQKPVVSVNANVIVQQQADLTNLREMSVADYIDIETFLFDKGYFNSTINRKYVPLSPVVEVLLSRRLGNISAEDSAARIGELRALSSKDQYEQYFYRPAVTQQYSLNVSGGTDYMAWLIAGNYEKNIDNLDAKYQKLNFRLSNSFRVTRSLQFDIGVYYTGNRSNNGKDAYSNVSSVNGRYIPYLRFADDNGQPLSVAKYYRNNWLDTAGAGKLLDWKYYPIDDYKHRQSITRRDEIVANAGVTYKLIDQLQLNVIYQYQQQRTGNEQLQGIGSFDTRNTINLFSQLDRATGEVKHIVPVGDILNISNASITSQNLRAQLNFSKQWRDHTIVAIAGAETQQVIGKSNRARFYGYQQYPISFVNVDYVNPYPTFITGRNQTISEAGPPSRTTNRFVSVFGNVNYTFKGKYSISASARRDGSNIFGAATNDKWKPLWSAGAGWNIDKEDFFKLSWLSQLKLRLTYGTSGNVDLSRTPLPLAGFSVDPVTNLRRADITTLNNPNLRWETVAQFNAGLQFSVLSGVITGSVDYYHKHGYDLYGLAPYDYTAWGRANTIIANIANMRGRGIDLMLTTHNLNKSVKWSTTFLYNYTNNKTTKYFDELSKSIAYLTGGGKNVTPVIGKPLYSIAAFKWGGLDASGNPQGYVDGKLSTDYTAIYEASAGNEGQKNSLLFIGSSIPTSTGSLINTIGWKNLELSFNIAYKLGYYFRKPAISYAGLVAGAMSDREYAQRWQKPGDERHTNVPSFVYPVNGMRDAFYQNSTVNALKGDHIRLQYVNLSYAIENMRPIKSVQQLQVYFNLANIGVLWKANKHDIDPEYPNTLPRPLSFAFGIRGDF